MVLPELGLPDELELLELELVELELLFELDDEELLDVPFSGSISPSGGVQADAPIMSKHISKYFIEFPASIIFSLILKVNDIQTAKY